MQLQESQFIFLARIYYFFSVKTQKEHGFKHFCYYCVNIARACEIRLKQFLDIFPCKRLQARIRSGGGESQGRRGKCQQRGCCRGVNTLYCCWRMLASRPGVAGLQVTRFVEHCKGWQIRNISRSRSYPATFQKDNTAVTVSYLQNSQTILVVIFIDFVEL